jgi:hypothetical protein
MKFPWSTLSDDPMVAGCSYPTHQTMGEHYDYDGPRSVYRIPRDNLADFDPDFHYVQFESKAKRNDLIASAPIPHVGWIISDRYRDLLLQFALPPHRLYPLPVVQRGKSVDGYSYLHLPQISTGLTESTTIHDAEKTLESRDEILALDVIPIYTPIRFGYFFVSYSLRQAIESANLTGIRFGTSKLFRSRKQIIA